MGESAPSEGREEVRPVFVKELVGFFPMEVLTGDAFVLVRSEVSVMLDKRGNG